MLVSVYEKTRRNTSRACPQGRNKLQGVRPLGSPRGRSCTGRSGLRRTLKFFKVFRNMDWRTILRSKLPSRIRRSRSSGVISGRCKPKTGAL